MPCWPPPATTLPSSCAGWRGFCAPSSGRSFPRPCRSKSAENDRLPVLHGRPDSASAEGFVERGPLLLLGCLVGRFYKVVVELAHKGIEPAPFLCDRLKDHGASVTPNADIRPGETKFLREPHCLRPTRPEKSRRFHRRL